MAAEESLERKYRLQPGPIPKAGHAAAELSLEQALRQVGALGDAADRQLTKVVLREHQGYVSASAQLFLSVDRHDPVTVTNAIDTNLVDPVFGVIEAQVYAAATTHEARALDEAASVSHVGNYGVALHAPFSVFNVGLDIDASVGIALAEPGDDVETVLRHADVAMYAAKAAHHPFACYEASRDDNTLSRLVLLGDLRRAVENGELTLLYQPKVDTEKGT